MFGGEDADLSETSDARDRRISDDVAARGWLTTSGAVRASPQTTFQNLNRKPNWTLRGSATAAI